MEGLTEEQHKEIFDKVKDLMFIDPAELLPKHQHLTEIDFSQLDDGSMADRQYWIESMESDLDATNHIIDWGIAVDIRKALRPSKKKHSHAAVARTTLQQSKIDESRLV